MAAMRQRLATGPMLPAAFAEVLRHPRRSFLRTVLVDVTDGAQALGELDFAGL